MEITKLISVSCLLFLVGVHGLYTNRKNILIMIMCLELILLAVNLNFLFFSLYCDDVVGMVFSILILTVAAAESAIGLALLVIYYRARGSLAVEFISLLKD
jgi:NADH-quinone oxidoreductase subunit K